MNANEAITQALAARAALVPTWAARDVADAELQPLFEAVRVAPSADNLQIWRLVVLRAPAERAAVLAGLLPADRARLEGAPLLIVFLGVRHVVGRVHREQPFFLIDVPLAATHLLLTAAEAGLRAEQAFPRDEAAVLRAVGAAGRHRAVLVVGLGYPGETHTSPGPPGSDAAAPGLTVYADRFGNPLVAEPPAPPEPPVAHGRTRGRAVGPDAKPPGPKDPAVSG